MSVTMANWYTRMSEDMRLHDYRVRTQEAYLLSVRQFLEHMKREPEVLTEEDVRAYALYLRDVKAIAPSTRNVAVCAMRFFFSHTVQREWDIFDLLRVHKPRTLPVVLSIDEVRKLLGAVRLPVRRVALTTIYAHGLRLGEGLALEAGHIDSDRLMLWVREGKGARDRGIPLPRPVLARLRHYWKHERPVSSTKYLFLPQNGLAPFDESTLQKTFTAALRDTGIA